MAVQDDSRLLISVPSGNVCATVQLIGLGLSSPLSEMFFCRFSMS